MKLTANDKGWLVAALLAASPPLLMYIAIQWWWPWPDRKLTPPQLEALSDAVTVSIALCVGYLTIDRFRMHKQIQALCAGFLKDAPKEALLVEFRAGKTKNTDKLGFLTLLWFAEDEETLSASEGNAGVLGKTDFFRSPRGFALRWFLRAKADRKLAIVVLVLLAVWQFLTATVQLRPEWGELLSARVAWCGWLLMAMGFFYPAIMWVWSDTTVTQIKVSSDGWLESIANQLQNEIHDLEAPTAARQPRTKRRTEEAIKNGSPPKPSARSRSAKPAPRTNGARSPRT